MLLADAYHTLTESHGHLVRNVVAIILKPNILHIEIVIVAESGERFANVINITYEQLNLASYLRYIAMKSDQ